MFFFIFSFSLGVFSQVSLNLLQIFMSYIFFLKRSRHLTLNSRHMKNWMLNVELVAKQTCERGASTWSPVVEKHLDFHLAGGRWGVVGRYSESQVLTFVTLRMLAGENELILGFESMRY